MLTSNFVIIFTTVLVNAECTKKEGASLRIHPTPFQNSTVFRLRFQLLYCESQVLRVCSQAFGKIFLPFIFGDRLQCVFALLLSTLCPHKNQCSAEHGI